MKEAAWLLEARAIELTYHDQLVLKVPELALAAGEVLGVIGSNGAGKSNLVKVLALLVRPNKGRVYFQGREILDYQMALAARRRMAVVFQDPLLLDRSVLANTSLGLRFRGVGRAEARRRAAYWLEALGISRLARRRALNLSGGEAQRVNLARALATEPSVLFLDEPFSALDSPTRSSLIGDLSSILKGTRTTAIFVTHDLREIPLLAPMRVIALEGGTITWEGGAEEVAGRLSCLPLL